MTLASTFRFEIGMCFSGTGAAHKAITAMTASKCSAVVHSIKAAGTALEGVQASTVEPVGEWEEELLLPPLVT